jgi:hypothetical protein
LRVTSRGLGDVYKRQKLRFVTAVSEWVIHLTNHSKHNNQKSTSIYHHPAGSQSNTKEVRGPTP